MPETKQVERIIRILQRLALGRDVTVGSLYDYFNRGVPKRTLQRDLVELSSADIPLRTRSGKGRELVWYIDSAYLKFLPMTVDSREMMASYFLERLAAVAKGTTLETDVRSLLKKAKQFVSTEVLHESDSLGSSSDYFGVTFMGHVDYTPHSATIDGLITAISERKRCRFVYKTMGKRLPSEFDADPYLILYHKGALYAVVYVAYHDNFLFLPIQRIRSLSITESSFRRRKDFSLDKLRSGRLGIFGGEGLKPQRVVLKFEPAIAEVVAERVWHPSQSITRHKDGSATLTLRVIVSDELRSWVGSWLDYVKVIRPVDLLSQRDSQRR